MTMHEAERLNQVLVAMRDQYLTAFQDREGARWEVRREARELASDAQEAWAARRLREAVRGFAEALLVLRQV